MKRLRSPTVAVILVVMAAIFCVATSSAEMPFDPSIGPAGTALWPTAAALVFDPAVADHGKRIAAGAATGNAVLTCELNRSGAIYAIPAFGAWSIVKESATVLRL